MTGEPIASYGLLSDCNSAALVSNKGSIDWLCFPRYDGPSVFARLLDPRGGHWSIRPVEPFSSERRYEEGTLVLATEFATTKGAVRLVDAMGLAPGQRGHELGLDSPREILRLVEGLDGEMELEMQFSPRPEYGLSQPFMVRDGPLLRTRGGSSRLVMSCPIEVPVQSPKVTTRFILRSGESLGFALAWGPLSSPPPRPSASESVDGRLQDCKQAWRSWESDHDIYHGRPES